MQLKQDAQEDIKSNLEEKEGHNILAYSNYVCSVIGDDEINFIIFKKIRKICKHF